MSSVTPQQSDYSRPQPHLIISAHGSTEESVDKLAYLPDGRRVVTGSSDGTVRVWNVDNREQEGTSMEHDSEDAICSLAVCRDGTKIISSTDGGGSIKVWDVESRALVKEWSHPWEYPEVAISPDDRLVAIGNRPVVIYTMEGSQVNDPIEVDHLVWSLCFSPDGDKLACGTSEGIFVYDVKTGTLLIGHVHEDCVECVLWSRDGSRLISGNETICCWSYATGKPFGPPWTGHDDEIFSLSLSPDGSILASASRDRTVRLWDTTSGDPIGQPLQHVKAVTAVCFSPSGEFMASAGWDGKIYLWRVPWLDSVEDQVIAPSMFATSTHHPRCCRHVELSLMYVTLNLARTSLLSSSLASS
ncbi:WD40-repeat-containing domain protein [Lanmaoa asiatica]|nr:WD40-repeat-containing domain protein [Lanmaoa asiatica]